MIFLQEKTLIFSQGKTNPRTGHVGVGIRRSNFQSVSFQTLYRIFDQLYVVSFFSS
jgi:hypothetical protein